MRTLRTLRCSAAFRPALLLLLALAVVGLGLAGALLTAGPETRPAYATAGAGANPVTAVSIASSPASGANYRTGETITVALTFTHRVHGLGIGAGVPALAVQIGGNSRSLSAALTNPTTATVNFNYTVTAADYDADGITVARNALSGNLNHVHSGDSLVTPHSVAYSGNSLPNTLVAAQSGHQVNSHLTSYDTNGNNLIEISSLAQLNAIRYDVNGDGARGTTSVSDWANYTAAFPTAAPGMGCAAACTGYELTANLDFDTTGDDVADAPYANWNPVPDYSGVFDGNGYAISNLNINNSVDYAWVGMFSGLSGSTAVIRSVGLINPTVRASGEEPEVGNLLGRLQNGAKLYAAYTSGGSVTSNASDSFVGGLVAWSEGNTSIQASYNRGTSVRANQGATHAGGLVGNMSQGANITASYVAASVTHASTTIVGGTNSVGGLTGWYSTAVSNIPTVTNSYWDTIVGPTSSGGGTGKTTTQLQTPTGYTGDYAAWNLNLDGVAGNDDPWDFGTSSQYPIINYRDNPAGTAVQRPTDYDTDGDNLIEISTLAQLNAIRYDVNGDGARGTTSVSDWANYTAAFPDAAAGMGCAATCTGYELMTDLDFDTTGDDDVADAPYANWTPISDYSVTFDGNGYAISNLNINNTTSSAWVGMFAGLSGSAAVVHSLGLINPTVRATGVTAVVGALSGRLDNGAKVYAVYVRGGSVTSTGDDVYVGGLIGEAEGSSASLQASYNRSATVRADGNTTQAGGLVGGLGSSANITASYAAASVTNAYTAGVTSSQSAGGVVGVVPSTSTVTNSYWDTSVTGGPSSSGGGTGRTTTQLRTPTAYGTGSTDIYKDWNVNVDGVAGNDDPWDFGTASQYPILQFGHDAVSVSRQRGGTASVDYDANDNNLVDIAALAQLDAIRWDLDGNGRSVTGANAVAYAAAFPNLMAGMGCPDGCTGYELAAHLDFDTTGDDDVADAPYANWAPIGDNTTPYAADFNGQGYTISNLRSRHVNYVGLFGVTGPNSDLAGVGLPGVDIVSASGASVGALAGVSRGTVTASWSTGSVTARHTVGGLLGRNGNDANDATATVANSYSTAAVSGSQSNAGIAGGLVGNNYGVISNSYAAGAVSVTGTATPGGLAGNSPSGSTITNSYFNSTVTTGSNSHGAGQTTSELQTPTTPPSTGAYAGWDTAVWDFGMASDYPILKYGNNAYGQAVQRPVDYSGDNNLIDVDSLAKLNAIRWDVDGNGVVAAANLDNYLTAFPGMVGCDPACAGYELTADLDFDTTGDNVADAPYANWTPLPNYTATFNGNGHAISNLNINNSTDYAWVGLFSGLTGSSAVIHSVGLINPTVAFSGEEPEAGTLLGKLQTGAKVYAAYVRGGSITANVANSYVGGLIGWSEGNTSIQASYNRGTTVRANFGTTQAGGLVGNMAKGANITASYAAASVTSATTTLVSGSHSAGGLTGWYNTATTNNPSVTNSYWDTTVGPTNSGSGATGYATSALQTPTSYAGIYANWNVNADGDTSTGAMTTGADDPWDFGTASQYPALKLGYRAQGIARQRGGATDYDANDNNLIEVDSLAKLNAVRYDLDGDGNSDAAGAGASAYLAAFPALAPGMGCPDGCQGYELTAHLDFDTDEDGSTHTSGTSDDGDDYHNGGAGWDPIGDSNAAPWNAVFDGQGYVIRHLFIKGNNWSGLFGAAGTDAVIRGVGLPDAYVDGVNGASVGALVGANAGTVSASWSSGSVESRQIVGGLVGRNGDAVTATVTNSYSTATVTADGGGQLGNAGGLVGYNSGIISNSYAAGAVSVTGNPDPGGLVGGQAATGASITASYFDSGKTTGSNSHGTAQTATQLSTPLTPPATGTYAGWDTAVWDFGTASDYPILKYGGNLYGQAVQRPVDHSGANTLIDVDSLAKLNAIRWDVDGNGVVAAADLTNYLAAFPGMLGCNPACTGYELTADLDFDTAGDDDVADAPYANWEPPPQYSGVFDGNGYTISNLKINHSTNNAWVGLFSGLDGSTAAIHSLGLINPNVTGAGDNQFVGALVGRQTGASKIYAVYVSGGSVTTSGVSSRAGGLTGETYDSNTSIQASYNRGTTVRASGGSSHAGGLTAGMGQGSNINASYAAASVTNAHTTGLASNRSVGGLAPWVSTSTTNNATVTNSYWDTSVTGAPSGSGGGTGSTGRTTAQLQTPTSYAGIYANWNVNADSDTSTGAMTTGADDPWNFGTSSEYPVIQLGYGVAGIARQWTATTDYDANDNNLIDIATLAQLNAVRYDADGNGNTAAGADTAAYLTAFPTLAPGMGCPDGCQGYELTAHLNFDTAGDDNVADAPYANWTPLPTYTATFDGQGYTISNLNLNRGGNYARIGLFSTLSGSAAVIRAVGLINPTINATGTGALAGALAGRLQSGAKIQASYVRGGSVTTTSADAFVGGLVAFALNSNTRIQASYNQGAAVRANGNSSHAGGLVAQISDGANINASYAAASVANAHTTGVFSTRSAGGLVGFYSTSTANNASVTNSYWDNTVGPASSGSGSTGYATSALQTPTAYGSSTSTPPSIYANWNVNVDGDTGTGTPTVGGDDPWDFGTASDYPILKYGGNAYGITRQRPIDHAGGNTLIDVDSLAKLNAIRWDLDGNGRADSAANQASYQAAFPKFFECAGCNGYELTADLDFDTNDSGATHTGGTGDAGDAYYNGGAGWTPIGHWTTANDPNHPYAGVFDGNNHAIANLFISSSTSNNNGGNAVALFGATTGVLRDLVLLNPYVSNTRTGGDVSNPNHAGRAAALVARVNGGVSNIAVSNVEVRGGSVTYSQSGSGATYGYVGCLVGEHDTATNINDSSASCTVTVSASTASAGYTASGGLVGYIRRGNRNHRNYATGSVSVSGSDNHDAGGLIGYNALSTYIISSYATGNVVSTGTTTNGSAAVGGLIGESYYPDIIASWASGNVTAAAVRKVGGLAGKVELQANDVVRASYATGNVSRSSTDGTDTFVGGLIGQLKANDNNSITATYATGAVSKTAAAGNIGGLVGGLDGSGAAATPVAYSYWTNGQTASGGTAGATDYAAATTATLQSRTGYTNEFANWNLNLDGQAGNDDPWDFGTASQLPVLKYGHGVLSVARQRGGGVTQDYDANDNNLIDIDSLAQLNAIRYDADGSGEDGIAAGANAAAYANAFPGLAAGMGCPAGCQGYELTAHLNFDTTGDNVADAPYANWAPLPDYSGVFDGNGYTIANLNINNSADFAWVGLFSGLSGSTAVIRSVGLINPTVVASGEEHDVGTLLGRLQHGAKIYAAYVRGGSVTSNRVDSYIGGLVAWSEGSTSIQASYNRGTTVRANGNGIQAGGLVSNMADGANIIASYAAASVTNSHTTGVNGNTAAGGLTGWLTTSSANNPSVTNSYWDTTIGPTDSGAGAVGKTTTQLQTPTGYTGDYAAWNLDLDGVTGADDPWDFGTDSQYPILQYGGHSTHSAAWRGRGGFAITQNNAAVTALAVTEADANGSSYGIALAVRPDAAVTVTITSDDTSDSVTFDTGDGTFSDSETLTFTTANWNTPQTLTLKAAADANIGNETTELDFAASDADASSPSGYTAVRRDDVPVTATDSSTISIIVSTTASGNAITALNLNEFNTGANQDYYVRLSNLPDAAVTVTIASDDDAVQIHDESADFNVGNFSRNRTLNFTTANWNTGQEVTVRALNDANPTNETVTLSHTGSDTTSAASGYAAVVANLTVNVTDDDTPNIALSESGAPTVTEGTDASAAYTVRLTTAPAAGNTVTVTLTAAGATIDTDGDGTFTASETLTFTSTTYNTAQNVAIRTADDDDLADGSATITHRSSGDSDYNNLSETATVTITNAETGAINLSPTALTVDEGSNATYTVALDKRPAADATVSISSDTAGVTVNPTSLTFTRAGWSASGTRTVTVTAADNDGNLTDDPNVDLTHTGGDATSGMSSGYAISGSVVTANLDVTVRDTTTASIIISATASGNAITALSINELPTDNRQEYYVRLSDLPDAAVTVAVSSDNAAVQIHDGGATYNDADFSSSRNLSFSTSDWNSGKLVTLRAVNDNNPTDETVTITHTGSPSGSGYNGVVASLTVNVNDDDTPGIALSNDMPTVTEGTDASAAYTVRLTTQPQNNVTVTLTATGAMIDTDGDSTYSASETLTFTNANYAMAQNVDIRTADDADLADGSATITHRSSGDPDYSNLSETATVTITNAETGVINLTPTPPAKLEVNEGSTATYTVALGKQPKADATVAITIPSNAAGVTVNPTSLTFTRSGWSASGTQTVTVTAPNDSNLVADSATLTHTGGDAVSGTASGYAISGSVVTAELGVTVADTTTATIDLSLTTISIDEQGADVTYTVQLSDQPSADVTVTISSDDPAITLDGPDADTDFTPNTDEVLTFTPSGNGAWNVAQTVTVRAPDDDNPIDERVTLTHTGSDPGTASGYKDVTASLTVTVDDNDTPGIGLSSRMLNVDEDEPSTNLYTVRLNTEPANNASVTVTLTATGVTIDADGDGTYSASETLTFTNSGPTSWETPQNISVRGPANNNDLAGTTGSIVHRAASADNDYQGQTETAAVAIANTETGSIEITAPADFAVPEGGTAAYTVKLDKRPLENVSVAITSTNSSVTLSPPPLTFTRSNWNRAQTVTLTAAADSDLTDGSTTLDHAASNAGSETSGYAGVIATLTVPVHDTTAPGIALDPDIAASSINEGSYEDYDVELDAEPAAAVTVAVASNDPSVTVSVSSLTFTTSNWSTVQTVRVTAATDADAFNNAAAVTFTPTMRDTVGAARTLAILANEADPPADGARTRIAAPPAGTPSAQHTVDTQPVTVRSDAGTPDSIIISTVQALTSPLDLTLTAPPDNVPARGGGFRLNAGSIVDITVTPAVPSAGLEICLPKGRDDIMMLRYTDSGGWVEVPGSRVVGDRICATITDFSVFGVGRRAGAELLETAIEFGEGRYAEITVQVQDTTTESVRVTWVVGAAISGTSASANDFANADHTAPLTSFPRGSITVPPGADATAVIRIPIYDDALAEGPERFTVRITQASGGIADHNDLPIEAVIALSDPTLSLRAPDGTGTGGADDTANAPLTAASTLVITEGQTHAYTIALSARPDGNVTVVIHSNHDGVTTNPPSVDFTRANWQQPKRVTVTTAQDGDDDHDQATLTHILTDADGALIEIIDRLKLFVVDTDPPDDDDIC